ncbi:hypothetical protein F5050DRAFT_1808371 [Lentinula boryana]|uniref:Myb-like domain-containing protein n=1 Tax=Lentinula boryana TaxID=40481 RepID=A0ABQ8QBB2_9AGAR|nr:hypothetical protein F5050DRAFT_1808371 [Lentinula boryana]
MGRPKGSKNQSSKENSNPNIPEPPRTTLSAKAQPKKNAKSTKTSPPPDAEKQTRRRAIFSEDDDLVMIHTLLEQKDEGMASDNGGWKKLAINAVVRALEGSELVSGGSPKTFCSVQDHYTKCPKRPMYRPKDRGNDRDSKGPNGWILTTPSGSGMDSDDDEQ